MYIPASFRIEDVELLSDFIRTYSFATLITHDGQRSQATHLPMFLCGAATAGGQLLCHMARANPQWQQLSHDREVLVVFTGPHTYISPSLYAPANNVPTWNYTAVHVYTQPRIVEQPEELDRMLIDLVANYEAGREQPWLDTNDAQYRQQLLKAIVGIELNIVRVEGKFKLNQNKSHEIERVIEGLSASSHPDDRAVADFMRKYYHNRGWHNAS